MLPSTSLCTTPLSWISIPAFCQCPLCGWHEFPMLSQRPLCGHNKLDHLVCEIPILIKTACGEKESNELALSVICIFKLAVPLCLILASYASIGHAILKIKSTEERKNSFGTCSFHLIIVLLFYAPAISMYLQPPLLYYKRPTQVHGSLLSMESWLLLWTLSSIP